MRKLFFIVLLFFGILAIVVAALPLWLPWVLQPVAARFGLEYEEYERIGYTRFELKDVEYRDEYVTFSAGSIVLVQPVSWLPFLYFRREEDLRYAYVEDWKLIVEERVLEEPVEEPDPEERLSLYDIMRQVESILPAVSRWAPLAEAVRGEVFVDEYDIRVRRIVWDRSTVSAEVASEQTGRIIEGYLSEQEILAFREEWADLEGSLFVEVEADLRERWESSARALVHPFGLELALRSVVDVEKERFSARGEIRWEQNHLLGEAVFGAEGFVPERVRLDSERIFLPGEYLAIEGYRDFSGDLFAGWEADSFRLQVAAEAVPLEADDARAPPVEADLRVDGDLVRGDLNAIRLGVLTVDAPWLQAELSSPLEIDRDGRVRTDESVLVLRIDGDVQPFFPVQGTLDARLSISPGPFGHPEVEFEIGGHEFEGYRVEGELLQAEGSIVWPEFDIEEWATLLRPQAVFAVSGSGLAGYDVSVESAHVSGRFQEPIFEIDELDVVLNETSFVRAHGGMDIAAQQVLEGTSFTVELGGDVAGSYLPEGFGFTNVRVSGQVEGALERLRHEINLSVADVVVPEMEKGNLEASWRGEFLDIDAIEAIWRTEDDAIFSVSGAASWAEEMLVVELDQLLLAHKERTIMDLASPTRLQAERMPDIDAEGWEVALTPFRLEGEEQVIALQADVLWPLRGSVVAGVDHFDPAVLAPFLALDIPEVPVRALALSSSWDDGPLTFRFSAEADIPVDEVGLMGVRSSIEGDAEGVRIDAISVTADGEQVVNAWGHLPVVIHPRFADDIVDINWEQEIRFVASTEPEAEFWQILADWMGISIEEPALMVDISGSLTHPRGSLGLDVRRIDYALEHEHVSFLRAEDLHVRASLTPDEFSLDQFQILVEGQEVQATAQIPFGEETWTALVREGVLPDWSEAAGAIRIENAEVRPIARFLPTVLAPQGTFDIDVALRPDGELTGEFRLRGAATRPMVPLSPVHELQAHIRFAERQAVIEEFSGLLGGELVEVGGNIDLTDLTEPVFAVTVRGTNLPLARQPGLVLRGDVDVTLVGDAAETPVIGGNVTLRNSLYFAELRIMGPGAVAAPERRPPFFSVDVEPFAAWQLDMELRGGEFLTIRTPVFRGSLSADFNLEGTLMEPQAIGEVSIDSGAVRFPFASIGIDQGFVTLTRENPYRPQLFVTGSSRAFGYELNMEVRGTADAPIIEFFSNPPLSSEAILFMVSAGQVPESDISFTGQQRASRLAFYIGQNLFYDVGEDDGEERLTIRSGEYVSEQGRETYYLEYRLGRRWSVVGEYDQFDDYNLGLKWRIFSR